jgi:hypothetical protein
LKVVFVPDEGAPQRLCRDRVGTPRQSLESLSPRPTEKTPMKQQRLPRGWTEKQIRDLAAYHDSLTEEEQAAKIEAALTR